MSRSATAVQVSSTSDEGHSQQPLYLDLRVLTSHVGLNPQPPGNITSNQDARSAMTTIDHPNHTVSCSGSAYTCLLSGPLDDFLLYSRQEHSQWLIDIAHDICDPARKRGSLKVWDEAGRVWRNVNGADPLIASNYVYDVQTVITLSKISVRAGKSRTSATGSPKNMERDVKQRDGQRCWVSRARRPLINSHICPKRMGDHLLRVVYDTFVSTPAPGNLSIYDATCGISLARNLDAPFGTYEFGLRFVAPNEYECHSFPPPDLPLWQCTIFGDGPDFPASVPRLHGYRASPPQPQKDNNPPPGLIRWHYLQCVIRKFAHSDYRNLQNINCFECPLRMVGDSDDEGTDSGFGWPTAVLDHGRAMQAEIKQQEERQKSVADWIAATV